MEWTDETIARLKELWAEGLSTAEIGRRLSITKNAVVGKAHRLSLPPRPSPIRRNDKPKAAAPDSAEKASPSAAPVAPPAPVKEKAAQPAVEAKPAAVTAPVAAAAPAPQAAAAPQPKAEAEAKPAKVEKAPAAPRAPAKPKAPLRSISDPEPKKRRGPSCCWPIGDPGTPGFHFCGATPLPGKPYCAEHAQIAYVKLRDRRDNVA
ncbi:GcrA cell cycle regulator [Acetobacter farinalis]|uniref:GcrA cell cycle regulator n=1 Tax=Acetobacter farinalis TaxID=1260984 RepID=A0ABT3Q625_9PROT|nr:GcrA family cell cycle regulator [Acetobacter farinalis]MCX2560727.1 GcrA cell cycle regulator [Acetobacter farinalis]NHO29133.1 GcrA cell cycle regulator [Acetobacter farinalis]